mgnify:CR=1 FL=1
MVIVIESIKNAKQGATTVTTSCYNKYYNTTTNKNKSNIIMILEIGTW